MAIRASGANVDDKPVRRDSDEQPPFLERSKRFLLDVRTEMRKVTTPSQKQVQATTGVVIITVFLFAAYFYVIDSIIGYAIDHVLQWASRI